MKKKFLFILVVLLIVTGCGTKKENDTNTNEEVKEPPKNEEKVKYIVDPNSKTRPFAIMINCHNGALPQAGLQDAYVVYELMVEGGITRMMALFKDIDSDKIGSIRSARMQYLDYALENNAIYIHAGGAPDALANIPALGINDIDVDGVYGNRDTSLNRSWEHTLFANTNTLKQAMSDKGIASESDTPNILKYSPTSFDFSKYESINANNISIKYSDYRTSNYVYDESKKVYLRSMNDVPNTDLVTNKQYEVKNIIVYGVNYTTYTYSGYYGYQRIDNIGTGEGYYISEGKAIPITWQKNDRASQTIYKIKETNEDLVVNNGNTYIQIYPINQPMNIN